MTGGAVVPGERARSRRRAGTRSGRVVGAVAGTAEQRGALFDETRRDIPEGSSGLVALVDADDGDAAMAALLERAVRVTRHRLSAADTTTLRKAVAQAPRSPPPDR